MKQTTDVYKQQYEGLLEEYQQYLQDLEILQAKSENLEKWKKVYEDEIAELKESAEKHTEEMVKANNKIAEFNRRDQVWVVQFQREGHKILRVTKVVFFCQCSKMQLISFKKFIIKIQFLWFFRLKC